MAHRELGGTGGDWGVAGGGLGYCYYYYLMLLLLPTVIAIPFFIFAPWASQTGDTLIFFGVSL